MAKQKAAEPIAAPPPLPDPYPHELPRILHQAGASRRVDTPDACEQALADGWTLRPVSID